MYLSRGIPIGYAKAIEDHGLGVVPPHQLSACVGSVKHVRSSDGREFVTYPSSYDPGPALCDHLEFALKHEGISLEVLAALFRAVKQGPFEDELSRHIQARPTGQNTRRLWFLYEFLTGRRLPLEDVTTGNYVELLDPKRYYTATPINSQRHRVRDNLLGNVDFCPMVRRTPSLQEFEAKQLANEAARIVESYDEDALRRAVDYLYAKETRSSFNIERETPSQQRAARFVSLLRELPALDSLNEAALVHMQNVIVEDRFKEKGYREAQNYVGESVGVGLRQRVHFISPQRKMLPRLMAGLLSSLDRMMASSVDPIVHAAAISFGFVFIHPFEDGNGRLHRLLIHYILSRAGFTPQGLIFPISAVMLQRKDQYDACLESFSKPLMKLIDYEVDEKGLLTVKGKTSGFYRYVDFTRMAEDLYRWTEETIRTEFRDELDFVVRYREARPKLDGVVELPDTLRNRFVQFCLQNGGRLSKQKRTKYFINLTDKEIHALEKVVQKYLVPRPKAPAT
ncbi:Fic family protein [Myxococcus llanfairpwllgwyngyllgogerychwyrndrobwllllantysiliogogogochensis]|uniref:Fic family protein n=1 Tax=Myxococcus llanfairpwllgwyngyllgogerychwyrndrobwllllantysiliogogogochensis TaxID=2590453 RepID=A0A540X3N4_9BACT|nr:Fic family protein [Myxococcus llanfairpwllgwyngyllgogerychwyrndrobwllllantysiliogogogochensis]TQF15856.1 Fic family protein [Myxococcus llanfairpwllgwyngyllgogerychwyrndrobwllllantysiliogogogochensis]